MNVIFKRMPGPNDPPIFRLMFVERNGSERPLADHRIEGGEALRHFLIKRLEVESRVATRVAAELEATLGASSYIENLPMTNDELHGLFKAMAAEKKEQERAAEEAAAAAPR